MARKRTEEERVGSIQDLGPAEDDWVWDQIVVCKKCGGRFRLAELEMGAFVCPRCGGECQPLEPEGPPDLF